MAGLMFRLFHRLGAGILFLAMAWGAHAQPTPVPPLDPIVVGPGCSLVDAVNAASTKDVGTSGCAPGTVSQTAYTIVIPAGNPTTLTTGSTVEPNSALVVYNNTSITIEGNGNLVQRSTAQGTPEFRIFSVFGATLTLNNLKLQGGRAALGGAIFTQGGTVILNNTTLSGNATVGGSGSGGAINAFAGVVKLNNSTITGNTTLGSGGGISYGTFQLNDILEINNSTISGNVAATQGGGIQVAAGSAKINNSTITGNSALDGGGFYPGLGGQTLVTNSVISGNSVTPQNGIPSPGTSTELGCSGSMTLSNNVIGHAGLTQTEATCQPSLANSSNTVATSDQANIPLTSILDTVLKDNGGPTFTHALVAGSPAINPVRPVGDTSNPTTTDQRGFFLNANALPPDTIRDIGAYEFNGVDPLPSKPTITLVTPGDTQLTVAFTPGSPGAAPITNYKYSLDGGPYMAFNPATTTSPVLLTGLTNGVTYAIRLRAVNANGDGPPSDPANGTPVANVVPTASNVSVTGTVQVGSTLTGTYTYADVNNDLQGTSTFRWLAGPTNVVGAASAIPMATSNTYVPVGGDVGKFLFFCVTPVAQTGASPGLEVCSVTATAVVNPIVTTVSGPSPTGTGTVTVTVSGGGPTCGITSSGFVAPPATPPKGVRFPHGFFQFTAATCPAANGGVTVTVTYPQPIPAGAAYYKYGVEPGNTTPHYYVIPSTISGNQVTFTITDGQRGDNDLTANATITDPGGIGIAPDETIIPTLGEYALMALAGLLMLGAMPQVRRQQQPNRR